LQHGLTLAFEARAIYRLEQEAGHLMTEEQPAQHEGRVQQAPGCAGLTDRPLTGRRQARFAATAAPDGFMITKQGWVQPGTWPFFLRHTPVSS
jgi:hypothetical protein